VIGISRATKTATIASAVVAVAALAGCGEERIACVGYDITASAHRAASSYSGRVNDIARSVAREGGSIRFVPIGADPSAQSVVVPASFAGLDAADADRETPVHAFLTKADRSVSKARGGDGSSIVASLRLLKGGCSDVAVLSDGLEQSPSVDLATAQIDTPKAREKLIATMADQLPDFEGAAVSFPFGGYFGGATQVPEAQRDNFEAFWRELSAKAGAKSFSWR
jgi:hypothetical protein